MPNSTVEDYVKAIYLIAVRSGADRPVKTGELAAARAVSAGTVTGMLKSLSKADLVVYTPNKGARLTSAGRRLAVRVIRRHRLLELFLARVLGLSWDEIHAEAEQLEHAVSERLIDRIDAYLGHPEFNPHGELIPRPDELMAGAEGRLLTELAAGERFRLVRVIDQDCSFRRYLAECGVLLDAEGVLVENRPEDGALSRRGDDPAVVLEIEAANKVLTHPPTRPGIPAAGGGRDKGAETVRIGG